MRKPTNLAAFRNALSTPKKVSSMDDLVREYCSVSAQLMGTQTPNPVLTHEELRLRHDQIVRDLADKIVQGNDFVEENAALEISLVHARAIALTANGGKDSSLLNQIPLTVRKYYPRIT